MASPAIEIAVYSFPNELSEMTAWNRVQFAVSIDEDLTNLCILQSWSASVMRCYLQEKPNLIHRCIHHDAGARGGLSIIGNRAGKVDDNHRSSFSLSLSLPCEKKTISRMRINMPEPFSILLGANKHFVCVHFRPNINHVLIAI